MVLVSGLTWEEWQREGDGGKRGRDGDRGDGDGDAAKMEQKVEVGQRWR